jgi:hypothetical protein
LISFFFYLVPVHRSHGVQLSAENGRTIISLFLVLTAVAILFELSTVAGATIGIIAALVLGWRCYRQLRSALAV